MTRNYSLGSLHMFNICLPFKRYISLSQWTTLYNIYHLNIWLNKTNYTIKVNQDLPTIRFTCLVFLKLRYMYSEITVWICWLYFSPSMFFLLLFSDVISLLLSYLRDLIRVIKWGNSDRKMNKSEQKCLGFLTGICPDLSLWSIPYWWCLSA